MTIKLLKGWNGNHPGTILNPELDGVAQLLILRGIAEEVKPEKPKKPKLQEWVKNA